jgi:D-alanyl-D-alanine carboxypeptidase
MRLRLLWWMVCLAPAAMASSPAIDPMLASRIDADAEAILQRTGTPGATIAIYRNGTPLYVHAYGLADRERKTPATSATHYEIGSITKQFTAAAILQLREAGKLDIDARLATYLPDAPHASEVTLTQLLSHTSGLLDYLDGPDVEAWAVKPATFGQIMARIQGKPLDFPPGSRWSYSNTGYVRLGRVIHDTVGGAAGNLVSTVADLEHWNVALRNGKIVRPADYALMATPAAGSTDYGLGLFVDTLDEQPRIGHTGGSFGFTTSNQYFPKQGIQVIAFTNIGDNPEPGQMLVTATFEALYPDIAAAARKPASGENAATTDAVRKAFARLQGRGEDLSLFDDRLKTKMTAGLSERMAKQLSPFGEPSSFIYKGQRPDKEKNRVWNDYLIEFGPGNSLPFGVELDASGKVAGISVG